MNHKNLQISFPQKRIPIMVITIILSILMASCSAPKESNYEGFFSSAFEVSVFYPCGLSTPTALVGKSGYIESGYWLVSTPDSRFSEQLQDFHAYREPTGQLNLYVKVVGTTSPTKEHGYGHLGMYSNQINVTEVLDMKLWDDRLCQLER